MNSFKDLLTGVLEVLGTPVTVAVIVIVSLLAFNDYERWAHRQAGPQNQHDLAITKTRSASALELAILTACRGRSTALWTCVGLTKRELTR
jgi:hypothetical protein